jgi:hypothetical protein
MRIIPRQLRDINSAQYMSRRLQQRSVLGVHFPKWPKSPRMPIYTNPLKQWPARAKGIPKAHTQHLQFSLAIFLRSSHNKQISREPRGDKLNSAAQRCFIAGHTVVIAPRRYILLPARRAFPANKVYFAPAFGVCGVHKQQKGPAAPNA